MDVDLEEMPCTHAWKCTCDSKKDILKNSVKPVIIEQSRPTESDRIVANFTKEILEATSSNSFTTMFSTVTQTSSVLAYIIKYATKHKTNLAQAISSIVSARKKLQETEKKTEKTFWNKLVNGVSGKTETPATIAAFALMGGYACAASDDFYFVFAWDAVSPVLLQKLLEDPTPEDESEGEESEESEEDMDERQNLQEDNLVEAAAEATGRIYKVDGKCVSIKQWEIYANRPDEMENLCLLTFCIVTELEEIKDGNVDDDPVGDGRRKANSRFKLKQSFILARSYQVRLRSLFKVPILAGGAPPEFPSKRKSTDPNSRSRQKWCLYWKTLLVAWRRRDRVSYKDVGGFFDWLLESLKEPHGSINRAKALYVINTTFLLQKNTKASKCIDLWRFRSAATRRPDQKHEEGTAAKEDDVLGEELADIANQLLCAMEKKVEVESHALSRQKQIQAILPQNMAVGKKQDMCFFDNAAQLEECCNTIETFEDPAVSLKLRETQYALQSLFRKCLKSLQC